MLSLVSSQAFLVSVFLVIRNAKEPSSALQAQLLLSWSKTIPVQYLKMLTERFSQNAQRFSLSYSDALPLAFCQVGARL